MWQRGPMPDWAAAFPFTHHLGAQGLDHLYLVHLLAYQLVHRLAYQSGGRLDLSIGHSASPRVFTDSAEIRPFPGCMFVVE